jgi:hypothetical protein
MFYRIQSFIYIGYIFLTTCVIFVVEDEGMSDFKTLETTHVESQKTTPSVEHSSYHLSQESEAQFTKPSSPALKATTANLSPLQPTQVNTDNADNFGDVKNTSKTSPPDTLDNLNTDENVDSKAPSTSQTQTIPSPIQTTHTQDESDTTSSEIETQKTFPKTTYIPLNSTNKLQDQMTHILPTVSSTKVSPSSLLSSVFVKQNGAGLTSDTIKAKSNVSSVLSVGGDESEQPTVINVNSSTDETDFEMEDKVTKPGTVSL